MFKKITLSAVGLLLLVSPLVSSAQTTSVVQAQIDALLKQITQLQTQIAALRGQSSAGAIPTTSSTCVSFARDFSSGATDGATNGEVSKLQQFLINAGVYPEALVTGYFGPATSRALQRWQTANGISISTAGIGSFGPRTRATIQAKCGNTPTSNVSQDKTFSDFGVSFKFPATLDQSGNFGQNFNKYNGQGYVFGAVGTFIGDAHQYASPAFTLCYPATNCTDNSLITNHDGSDFFKTNSGVSFIRTFVNPKTHNTRGPSDLGNITYLYAGPTKDMFLYGITFVYGDNAFYKTYESAKSGSEKIMSTVVISSYDHTNAIQVATNQPPVIDSFTGPTALAVSQQGIWSVQVRDPENAPMKYYVAWGDMSASGVNPFPCAMFCGNSDFAAEQVTSTTFSHTYQKAGTYNVRFTAVENDTALGKSEKILIVTVH